MKNDAGEIVDLYIPRKWYVALGERPSPPALAWIVHLSIKRHINGYYT